MLVLDLEEIFSDSSIYYSIGHFLMHSSFLYRCIFHQFLFLLGLLSRSHVEHFQMLFLNLLRRDHVISFLKSVYIMCSVY